MTRRSCAGLVLLVGIALIGLVLGTRLFERANAFERVSSDMRPMFEAGAISALEQDAEVVTTLARQFPSYLPVVATRLGFTRAQFEDFLTQYPRVERGLGQLPSVGDRLRTRIEALGEESGRFAQADSIPTKDRSTAFVPWFMLIVGIVASMAGIGMPAPSRTGAAVAMLAGAMVILAPLATQLPSKASTADEMHRNLGAIMTRETLERAEADLSLARSLDVEIRTRMLPALAAQTGRTDAQLLSALRTSSPSVAAALDEFPGALVRLSSITKSLRGSLADFQTAAGIRYAWIAWSAIGLGVVLLLLGALSEAGEVAVRIRETDHLETRQRRAA
ncbi:MAG: hypothetical protein WDA27_13585 [Actinomycetota bacterium]